MRFFLLIHIIGIYIFMYRQLCEDILVHSIGLNDVISESVYTHVLIKLKTLLNINDRNNKVCNLPTIRERLGKVYLPSCTPSLPGKTFRLPVSSCAGNTRASAGPLQNKSTIRITLCRPEFGHFLTPLDMEINTDSTIQGEVLVKWPSVICSNVKL